MEINEILKELRQKKHLTQQELASTLDINLSSYQKYERPNNTVKPSIEALIKIADFYDVTVDYLLGRKTEPPTPQNPYLNFKPVAEDWETLQKIIESLPERERIAVITFLHMLSGESDLPTMEMQQSKMIPKGKAGDFRKRKEAEAKAEAEAQRKETA